jgi:hypothetical protein
VSEDSWSDWKALLIVEGINVFIVLTIDIFIKVLFKSSFILELPKLAFVLLFATISFLHYYIFLHNDRWKEYEEEFKSYSRKKNRIINLSVFVFILLVLGSLIFAFYQMSLIEWSKYR